MDAITTDRLLSYYSKARDYMAKGDVCGADRMTEDGIVRDINRLRFKDKDNGDWTVKDYFKDHPADLVALDDLDKFYSKVSVTCGRIIPHVFNYDGTMSWLRRLTVRDPSTVKPADVADYTVGGTVMFYGSDVLVTTADFLKHVPAKIDMFDHDGLTAIINNFNERWGRNYY